MSIMSEFNRTKPCREQGLDWRDWQVVRRWLAANAAAILVIALLAALAAAGHPIVAAMTGVSLMLALLVVGGGVRPEA